MKQFSEATRVQMPAMVHLTRIGYTYFGKLSEDKNGTVYDGDTNILLQVFEQQFKRLNPGHEGEYLQVLKDIKKELNDDEIEKIVGTFQRKEAVDDFSVAVTYDEIREKNYSLSAGQYFDIKIDYVDITEEEFSTRMNNYKAKLAKQFAESHRLEEEIMKQLDALQFNVNVGNNE